MAGTTQHAVVEGGSVAAEVNPYRDPKGFVHLHLHSEYSLLDGGNRIDRLVKRVKELGMPAVAVTDHGNMHGAVAFAAACKEAGVRAILGVEAYVAAGDRRDRTYTGVSDGGYHLVLLAENQKGWENLLHLCSQAYLTGFYFKPRVDRELLAQRSEGLIAINGHLGSEMGEHLLAYEQSGDGKWLDKAIESAEWHAKTFADEGTGPRFYVEMQHHIAEQNSINKHLIKLAREMRLPLVCDNDSHFLREQDHDAHDTLICISMGKIKNDPQRLKYSTELYVKSPQQMRELFEGGYGDVGREACDNTLRIAERCDVKLPLGANHAPAVRISPPPVEELPKHDDAGYAGDLTAWYKDFCERFEVRPFTHTPSAEELVEAKAECDTALRMLSEAGMVWRYGPVEGRGPQAAGRGEKEEARRARLERELKILADKNISAYFLIVWDFVNWGRQNGIPALARGSGVGTMVGYVLGLSNACPVNYGLLFERFTDPDRSEYPDIDIDLCQDGRQRVIEHVRTKYGHVAQIITFGTLKARAAMKDVARVLGLAPAVSDRLCKLVPEQLNITLDEAIAQEPELKAVYEGKADALGRLNKDVLSTQSITPEAARALIDNARVLEGQARHTSVHAAGVIVATRPLDEIVPLYKQSGAEEHEIVTQWDGPTCEKMGLLKMDFLGLRTVSIIERAKRLIGETLSEEAVWAAVGRTKGDGGPHPLDLERLTYDDQRVFGLFQRADTTGVFQFESGGMRRLLVDMKPDRLEDLIAANALFRPGPMDLIPDYNRRKHGQDNVPQVHEIVDRYTAETYGVMVYQEQVMQIVHGLGGIKLRDAYSLIKNISKKKHDKIEKERPKFVEGAHKQGLSKPQAEELFELILKFAGYGFNKSHSTGYAIVAYQTAYLKTYFPAQYMAAFLTYESGAQKVSDWIGYVEDCKKTRRVNGKMGIEVRPPDANLSKADFSVVFDPEEPRDSLHGHIRFGLSAIKGVGEKAIDAIIKERDQGGEDKASRQEASRQEEKALRQEIKAKPYTSLFDFCERVLSRGTTGSGGAILNKGSLESLIKCGAMDCLGGENGKGRSMRAAMLASIEAAMTSAQRQVKDKAAGQGGLFGMGAPAAPAAETARDAAALAKVAAWSESETLAKEKEVLGFYVSSHPLAAWRRWANVFATASTETAREMKQDQRVVLPVVVQSVRQLVVKSGRSAGQKMAIVAFEDETSSVEGVLFADCYAQFAHLIQPDQLVFLLGRVDRSRAGGGGGGGNKGGGEEDGAAGGGGGGGGGNGGNSGGVQIITERVVPIEGTPLSPGRLWIRVDAEQLNGTAETALTELAGALMSSSVSARALLNGAGGGGAPLHIEGANAEVKAAVGGGSGGDAGGQMPSFPVDLVVDTAGGRVIVEAGPMMRAALVPGLVDAITGIVGEQSVRVFRGVAVEVTDRNARQGQPAWKNGKKAG